MFTCKLAFYSCHFVANAKEKELDRTENDSSRPPKHIYDTYTSQRPPLSAAANVSRVPYHHSMLYAFSPRFSSWPCVFNIELRLLTETLASGIN